MPAKGKQSNKAVKRVIDFKDIFESEKGADILYDLCKYAGYFSDPATLDHADLAFSSGKKSVINFILTQCQQNPALLMKEFKRRQQEELNYVD